MAPWYLLWKFLKSAKKIRQSHDHLIFIMGIQAMFGRWSWYLTDPLFRGILVFLLCYMFLLVVYAEQSGTKPKIVAKNLATSFGVFFSYYQAALRTLISVCLSVCPSVCPSVTPFWQCSCRHVILKFSGVITIERHDVLARGQGQRSKVKVTEVMTPFSRFRTVTPVWIHIWRWNDAQSLMLLRRWTLLYFKVIHQISRSHG